MHCTGNCKLLSPIEETMSQDMEFEEALERMRLAVAQLRDQCPVLRVSVHMSVNPDIPLEMATQVTSYSGGIESPDAVPLGLVRQNAFYWTHSAEDNCDPDASCAVARSQEVLPVRPYHGN